MYCSFYEIRICNIDQRTNSSTDRKIFHHATFILMSYTKSKNLPCFKIENSNWNMFLSLQFVLCIYYKLSFILSIFSDNSMLKFISYTIEIFFLFILAVRLNASLLRILKRVRINFHFHFLNWNKYI